MDNYLSRLNFLMPANGGGGHRFFISLLSCATLILLCSAFLAAGYSTVVIKFCAVSYFAFFIYLYVLRRKLFGFFLLINICYALLFGIPTVAWVFSNPEPSFSQANFVLGLLGVGMALAFFCYHETQKRRHFDSLFSFESGGFFIFLFMLVATAQAYKLHAYFSVISSSEYGHLAIWADGDALLKAVPGWVRLLSGGSILIGIAGLALCRRNFFLQMLCLLLIMSDVVIGIRNKGFFGVVAAIYVFSLFDRDKASRIFFSLSSPIYLMISFLSLSIVSYLREGFDIPFSEYLYIVLDSLASIVDGLLASVADHQCINSIDSMLVFSQFWTLVGAASSSQVSGEFNFCLTGDPNPLTSVSSSLIFEIFLLVGAAWPLIVCMYFGSLYIALHWLESRKTVFSFSILCAVVPAFFYVLRAEILQPLVFLIKALPYLFLIKLAVKSYSQPSLEK